MDTRADVIRLCMGLPDSYDSSARRRAEGLGFTEFRPLPGQKDMGYWIGRLSR